MNAGEVLCEMLAGHGVRHVFGIPGGQTAPLYAAIGHSGGQIHHILVRDERSGPYAADAYARHRPAGGVRRRPGIGRGQVPLWADTKPMPPRCR